MAVNFNAFVAGPNDSYTEFYISKRVSACKRFFDILLTILLLPIAMPCILLAMLVTRISSNGPVFFVQNRVGFGGRVFKMYKIRTMVYTPGGHKEYTVPGDGRVTPIGKFLRKTKVDELPQLWNVLRGDMSLVGPRPERVEIVHYFSAIDKNYTYRHAIKPGITGLAQVNCPLATPNENLVKLNFDLYYIANFSLLLELEIILKTIGVICKMKSL